MPSADRFVELGKAALKAGRVQDAVHAYNQALKVDPQHLEARFCLAGALDASDDSAGALQHLDRLAETHPEVAAVHFGRGNMLFRLERFKEATVAYEQGLEFQNDPVALRNLGQARERINDPSSAEQAYQAALELAAGDPKTLELYGRLCSRRGDHAQAEQLFQDACQRDPANSEMQFLLGNVLSDQARYADALLAYEQANQLAPRTANILYNIGHIRSLLRQWQASVDAFEQAIKIRPASIKSHVELAIALARSEEFERAESVLRTAMAVDEHAWEPIKCLGDLMYLKGDLDAAVELYKEVSCLDSQNASGWIQLSRVHQRRGDAGEAERCLRTAIQIDPQGSEGYRQLVPSLIRAERRDEALQVVKEWREQLPGDPTAMHFESALSRETPDRASQDYIVAEFDGFAPTFDEILTRLQYRGPELVGEALSKAAGERRPLDILDAGCGTGLCGKQVRSIARKLVGVDLSSNMISQARLLELYDHLEVAELTEFMSGKRSAYDAVVSADTFIYIGELDSVFHAAATALRFDGYLVFTVEELKPSDRHEPFRLNLTGRFAHTDAYVQSSLQQNGFRLEANSSVTLRNECDVPVEGRLYVASNRSRPPAVNGAFSS